MPLLKLLMLVAILLPGSALAVDGVVEINDARAQEGGVTPGDGPGLPVTISVPGSYVLTSNLSSSGADETVIEVTAADVTIDLNGFTIRCLFFIDPCAGTGNGVGIDAAQDNVTIRNGTVRDMPLLGVHLGTNGRIEDLHSLSNGSGMTLGLNTRVSRCTVDGNLGRGVSIDAGSIIDHCVIANNSVGVRALGRGLVVLNSYFHSNSSNSIESILSPSDIAYGENIFTSNNGTDAVTDGNQGIAGTEIGENFCGTNTGCP